MDLPVVLAAVTAAFAAGALEVFKVLRLKYFCITHSCLPALIDFHVTMYQNTAVYSSKYAGFYEINHFHIEIRAHG